ncbi:YsnF/AvaK domain-containing protein [Streptomyces sp. NPDC003863]
MPIKDAAMVDDHVKVPYPKDRVKDAPHVDVDRGGHLDAREEQRLYSYYGTAWDEAWQRANEPGEAGWAHGAAGAAGTAGAAGMRGRDGAGLKGRASGTARTDASADDVAMTRSEEQMHVGTERFETGRARLRKYVVTEEVQQTVPVCHEEVRAEREPLTDADREQVMSGAEISEAEREVTLHEERPVVETRAVPVDRVGLRTEEVTEEETVTGQVRKERIEVEADDTVDLPEDPGRGRDR